MLAQQQTAQTNRRFACKSNKHQKRRQLFGIISIRLIITKMRGWKLDQVPQSGLIVETCKSRTVIYGGRTCLGTVGG